MPRDLTLIRGGRLHDEHRAWDGDVLISGERIHAIGVPGAFAALKPGRVIDARGLEVYPGFIDVHVHLALPFCGTVSCDDFESGSRAAASGGITTLLDFAIPGPDQSLADAHDAWLAKSRGKSIVDHAWHLATTSRRHLPEIPRMIERGLPTFKQFMIYEGEGWQADDGMMFEALERVRAGGRLLVHAESSRLLDALIRRRHTPAQMRRHGARLHPMTRPNIVEAEAIERAIRWSRETRGPLYIVHMSTGEGADLVRDAQARGVPVIAETCVQYLTLDDSVFARRDGHLFACCPQVKKPADIDRLWRGLGREVSVVSTDTCSFTRAQKGMWWVEEPAAKGRRAGRGYGDWTRIPMGLPGLDTLIPLIYTHGVRAGRISRQDLVRLCAAEPARIMGLERKGRISPGLDADLTIIDPRRSKLVTPRNLRSRCDWNPWQGQRLHGFAQTTLVRGEVVVRNHTVVGTPGHGRFVTRRLPSSSLQGTSHA